MAVSYTKEQLKTAKKEGRGLITVAWEKPNPNGRGTRCSIQATASPRLIKYIEKVHLRVTDKLSKGQ